MKEPKVLKVVGNITYLESNYKESLRKDSWETRKKKSEKRRAREVQPRSGQSKKAQNLFTQLKKDYVTQTSALGRFMNIEKKRDDYEDEILENNDNLDNDRYNIDYKGVNSNKKKYHTITKEDKTIIKKWLMNNEDKLTNIDIEDGILNEYDIQKNSFNQLRMTSNMLEYLEEENNYALYFMEDNVLNKILFENKQLTQSKIIHNLLNNNYTEKDISLFTYKNELVDLLSDHKLDDSEKTKIISVFVLFYQSIYEYLEDNIQDCYLDKVINFLYLYVSNFVLNKKQDSSLLIYINNNNIPLTSQHLEYFNNIIKSI